MLFFLPCLGSILLPPKQSWYCVNMTPVLYEYNNNYYFTLCNIILPFQRQYQQYVHCIGISCGFFIVRKCSKTKCVACFFAFTLWIDMFYLEVYIFSCSFYYNLILFSCTSYSRFMFLFIRVQSREDVRNIDKLSWYLSTGNPTIIDLELLLNLCNDIVQNVL